MRIATMNGTAIRLGVLGCADIALRRVLPAVARLADVALTAVASRIPAKAAAVADDFGCSAVTGYGQLLERDDVDAVYIPLPIALHEEWVEAALRAGKHVLAEKPMATSRRQTEELLALARAGGLALMENVMFVHHSQHNAVRRLVEEGAIGAPRLFEASFLIPRLVDGGIRYRPELGGGALRELGIYPVRAALYHLGALEVVAALRTPATGELDMGGVAMLRAHPDVPVQLSYGIDHSHRNCYQIVGSDGRISLERAFTPAADHPPLLRVANRTGSEELRVLPRTTR